MKFSNSLLWFRRDLRLFDHAALHHALLHSQQLHCVFVYDSAILETLPRADRRVEFIHACLAELDQELQAAGGHLQVLHGDAALEIPALAARLGVDAVFVNHDIEPQAMARDARVAAALAADGRRMFSYKDQLIFEKNEVLTLASQPFSVFTPYKNAWLKRLEAEPHSVAPWQVTLRPGVLKPAPAGHRLPSLAEIGFETTNLRELAIPLGMSGGAQLFEDFTSRISAYRTARDFPALRGPSYLSLHLRFGVVSIRHLVRSVLALQASGAGGEGAATWLSELIWREFYAMILYHHPEVVERAFKPAYDAIVWETGADAEQAFAAWCAGRTGYPLVDAAMAQLNHSGYMHNRLRMVTASFLIKDLGIDWRWGERYFAEHLNDFELASNNGGWQWAASSGCDAQPYFRIFNPITQSEKFDPQGRFIRRYLPELAALSDKAIHAPWLHGATPPGYPPPIVQHAEARLHTLERYAVVKAPRTA